MLVVCCDDADMHLNLIQTFLKNSFQEAKIPLEIFKTGSSGKDAVDIYKEAKASGKKIDLITLDIRMPTMDGLSALAKIRSMDSEIKIVMVSSEDENTVKRKQPAKLVEMPEADRLALVDKVVQRVVADKVEPGKINFILDACEELHVNPIVVAQHLKANGYVQKPYKAESTSAIVALMKSGGGFFKC